MKTMLHTTLLSALFALPAAAQAPEWVTKAPGRETWPTVEAVILRHHVDVTLHPDGRTTRRVLIATKVLRQNPYNRQGLADPRIPFDSATQSVKVLRARVWTPAGRALDTAPNGINVVYPGALVSAPDHATRRDLVVTHIGIQEGCVSVIEYEVADKAPGPWPFEGTIPAQLVFPILDQRLTVKAPAGTPLQATLLEPIKHAGVECRYSCPNGTDYTFIRRGRIPAAAGTHDTLVYGTLKAAAMHTRLDKVLESMGPMPKGLVAALRFPLQHPGPLLTKADLVARILGEKLRLQALDLASQRWQVRPAAKVWQSAYATSLELAGLLRWALLEAGFTAVHPVPVTTRFDLKLPCLAAADDIWLACKAPGVGSFSFKVGGRPGSPDVNTLAGGRTLAGPVPVAERRLVAFEGHMRLDAGGGLSGELELLLEGLALRYTTARLKGLEGQVKAHVARLAGARTEKVTVTGLTPRRATAKASFAGGRCRRDKAGFIHLLLPLPAGTPAESVPNLHRDRLFGLLNLAGARGVEEIDFAVNLPPGLTLVHVPGPLEVKTPLGSLRLAVKRMGPTLLRYTCRLEIKRQWITPADWVHLKALLAPLANPANRTVKLGA